MNGENVEDVGGSEVFVIVYIEVRMIPLYLASFEDCENDGFRVLEPEVLMGWDLDLENILKLSVECRRLVNEINVSNIL